MQTAVVEGDGVIVAVQKKEVSLTIRKCKYLVMFTIDGSPSMNDGEGWLWWKVTRWSLALKAVQGFIESLQDDDRICTNIFDGNAKCVTEPSFIGF